MANQVRRNGGSDSQVDDLRDAGPVCDAEDYRQSRAPT